MIKKRFISFLMFTLICIFALNSNLKAELMDQENMADAEEFFLKCKENLKKGDIDKAIEYGEKAISLKDNVSEYYRYLGMAYNLKMRRVSNLEKLPYIEKLKRVWETAVQLDSKNTEARYRLAFFYVRVPEMVGGDIDKAKQHASELLKQDPIRSHIVYSEIYLKENALEKLESSVQQAYKLHMEFMKNNPEGKSGFYPKILNDHAHRLLNNNEIDKAITFFEMNVKAFPDYYNVYYNLAEAYMTKGDKQLAKTYYKKAMELNPQKTERQKNAYNEAIEKLKLLEK